MSTLQCGKDDGVVKFLKQTAKKFENLGKARTYLICQSNNGKLELLGYYSISLQVLNITKLTEDEIKELDGFSATKHDKRITSLPAILIGQFCKNDIFKNSITGDEIMEECFKTIARGRELFGGRVVFLECKNEPKLIAFYERLGFNKIEQENDKLIQLIKKM